MLIAETPTFTRRIVNLMADDDYRLLQLELVNNPRIGVIIRGSGGLRKLRWQASGRGKRGGARIIYSYADQRGIILMLFAFAKNERDDLTAGQLKILRESVRREFG